MNGKSFVNGARGIEKEIEWKINRDNKERENISCWIVFSLVFLFDEEQNNIEAISLHRIYFNEYHEQAISTIKWNWIHFYKALGKVINLGEFSRFFLSKYFYSKSTYFWSLTIAWSWKGEKVDRTKSLLLKNRERKNFSSYWSTEFHFMEIEKF